MSGEKDKSKLKEAALKGAGWAAVIAIGLVGLSIIL